MAIESGFKWDETFLAGADLSTKQFLFVKGSGTTQETIVVCDTLGEDAVGVLQNNPASGRDATVRLLGYSKVVASAAINAWAQVTTAATGKAVTASTGHKILGQCITSVSNADEIATIWLRTEPAVV